ncbi:helix-turn-helix domain-containing protein [Pseudomonas sp. F-14 TE3623]
MRFGVIWKPPSSQIKEIAHRCGFEHTDSLRRAFVKHLAISPVEYRQRFCFEPPASISATGGRDL